jgi:putative transcriptional regulator
MKPSAVSSFGQRLLAGLEEGLDALRANKTLRQSKVIVPPPSISGKRLVQLRKSRSMSLEQLAAQLNVRPDTVARWEAGKTQPRGPVLRLLEILEKEYSKRPHKTRVAESSKTK